MKILQLFIAVSLSFACAAPALAMSHGGGAAPAAMPAMDAKSCEAKAAEKKLAGAAKTSFMKKCEKDHGAMGHAAMCDKSAADKKLAGAAKTSHLKKCMADAAAPAK